MSEQAAASECAQPSPPSIVVTVQSGPDEGKQLASSCEPVMVGAHRGVDLLLSDPWVSPYHLELTPRADGFGVRDLDSRTGTFAGEVRLKQGTLPFGATLTLGRTRLLVEPARGLALQAAPARFGTLLGHSPAMARALRRLSRATMSDSAVLLCGEIGTGKSVAARCLHEASDRAKGPFVVVDCAARLIPRASNPAPWGPFGHEPAACAASPSHLRPAPESAFERARGGTLFLVEVGELATELQSELLTALERSASSHGSARVIAATHRDLRADVNQRRFNEELYQRLAGVELTLPPLRERLEDLPALVEALGRELATRMNLPYSTLVEPPFLAELARHDWPGNVRELRNCLERALLLEPHDEVPPSSNPRTDPASVRGGDARLRLKDARARAVAAFERRYLERILHAHDGNVTLAARAAGVDRVHFYRLLWRNGLRRMGSAS